VPSALSVVGQLGGWSAGGGVRRVPRVGRPRRVGRTGATPPATSPRPSTHGGLVGGAQLGRGGGPAERGRGRGPGPPVTPRRTGATADRARTIGRFATGHPDPRAAAPPLPVRPAGAGAVGVLTLFVGGVGARAVGGPAGVGGPTAPGATRAPLPAGTAPTALA